MSESVSRGVTRMLSKKKIKAELLELIRDEIVLYLAKGPGWWNEPPDHNYTRCPRCGVLLVEEGGCPCGMIKEDNFIAMDGIQ